MGPTPRVPRSASRVGRGSRGSRFPSPRLLLLFYVRNASPSLSRGTCKKEGRLVLPSSKERKSTRITSPWPCTLRCSIKGPQLLKPDFLDSCFVFFFLFMYVLYKRASMINEKGWLLTWMKSLIEFIQVCLSSPCVL